MYPEKVGKGLFRADRAMRTELERRWPERTIIRVRLNANQINLSEMEVAGHRGDGHVIAFMEGIRKYGRHVRFVKRVWFRDIEGWNEE